MAKPRDYRKEYDNYHCKRQQRKNRSLRNQARKKLGLKRGDGREVDHIRPLKFNKAKNPNTRRNLQVLSRKANRKKGSRSKQVY